MRCEAARRLKSEHGLRQVAVLHEENGRMGLMTTWESRDAWSGPGDARSDRDRVDMGCVDPAASSVLLLSET
jgi:hypothetical protein